MLSSTLAQSFAKTLSSLAKNQKVVESRLETEFMPAIKMVITPSLSSNIFLVFCGASQHVISFWTMFFEAVLALLLALFELSIDKSLNILLYLDTVFVKILSA